MLKRIEMDEHVSLNEQMSSDESPVVLVNVFKVAPEDAGAAHCLRRGPPTRRTSRRSPVSFICASHRCRKLRETCPKAGENKIVPIAIPAMSKAKVLAALLRIATPFQVWSSSGAEAIE
jgi:hypothetical protein